MIFFNIIFLQAIWKNLFILLSEWPYNKQFIKCWGNSSVHSAQINVVSHISPLAMNNMNSLGNNTEQFWQICCGIL